MTSRVSFPKLIFETIRRHIAIVLITVLTFVIHLIAFFLQVQNTISAAYMADMVSSVYSSNPNLEYIKEDILEMCTPTLLNSVIALIIGGVLAFDFFRYMHSKKETDFYESLPIRKQTWFGAIMLSCFGLFLILSTLTVGLELAIVYSVGYGSLTIARNMFWNLLCMIAAFLVGWVTTVLVMVLTGHPIVALLGLGVFSVYIPLIIGYLVPVYSDWFFETYVYTEPSAIYYYFSPATLVYKMSYNWSMWNVAEHWNYILGCYIYAIVIGIIAYLLFLRRPSETAGRAMAFEKTNFIIRFLLVVPLALYIGLFLGEVASIGKYIWLFFGVVSSAFLLHGIIECIFQFDIKALICKRKQLLLSIVISFGFVLIFITDLFGYDDYIPKEKDVKAVIIDTYLFDYGHTQDEWKDGLTGEYVSEALAVIKELRSTSNEYSDDGDYYMNDFIVTYKLKNGLERQRRYSYYATSFPKSLDKLYATEEFKNDYCILYHLEKETIKSVRVSNGPEYHELTLSGSQLTEFYEIYLEEYTNLTFTQTLSEPVVYELILEYPVMNKDYTVSNQYPVYQSFDKTIEYINGLGFPTFNYSEKIKLVNLELHGKYNSNGPQYISDETILNKLKKYMIPNGFMFEYNSDEYVYCDLRYELNGATNYMSVFLKNSDVDNVLAD